MLTQEVIVLSVFYLCRSSIEAEFETNSSYSRSLPPLPLQAHYHVYATISNEMSPKAAVNPLYDEVAMSDTNT